jgi:hypothetical protein
MIRVSVMYPSGEAETFTNILPQMPIREIIGRAR